jgi:hypothetical protein
MFAEDEVTVEFQKRLELRHHPRKADISNARVIIAAANLNAVRRLASANGRTSLGNVRYYGPRETNTVSRPEAPYHSRAPRPWAKMACGVHRGQEHEKHVPRWGALVCPQMNIRLLWAAITRFGEFPEHLHIRQPSCQPGVIG